MVEILGIHGMGQADQDAGRLTRLWSGALAEGWPPGAGPAPEVVVPHLAPLLHRSTGRLGDSDELTDEQAEVMVAMLREFLGDPDDDRLADLAQRGTTLGGFGSGSSLLMLLLKALDGLLPQPARKALIGLVKEVGTYLTSQSVRDQVRERLFGAGQHPDLVIGHSLGSVIAYDLAVHGEPVPTLMTLGSPLGFSTIRKHRTMTTSTATPPKAWTNIFDPYDPITRGIGLTRFWPVTDIRVDNGNEPHGISRYLAHPETGAAVVTLLE
jgi:hypothetical protein